MGATNLGVWKQPLPCGFGVMKIRCPDTKGPWGKGKCRDSVARTGRDEECKCEKGERVEGREKAREVIQSERVIGNCEALDTHLGELRECLDHDFPSVTGPAAMIVESIQGIGGTVQYPEGYLEKAFEQIHSRGKSGTNGSKLEV